MTQEQIRQEAERRYPNKHTLQPKGYPYSELDRQAAFIAGAEFAQGEKWVRAKERLPEIDEVVLWYHEGSCFIDALDKDGNPWLRNTMSWQPLPSPPSNTEKE